MDGKRLVALVVGAVLVAQPVVAGAGDTVTEDLIRTLNAQLLYAAVPVTVLVEGVLLYTVLRFRHNEEAVPTRENRLLEITWTLATAVVLVFVGIASFQVLANPMVAQTGSHHAQTGSHQPEGDPVEVTVVGRTYFWTFQYPEAGVESQGELVLPTDRPIVLNVTSRDWLHSFHVPGLGLKQDAFPGRSQVIFTRAVNEGTYQGYCAEYCGVGHAQMTFTVRVVSPEEYREWLDEQQDQSVDGQRDRSVDGQRDRSVDEQQDQSVDEAARLRGPQ